MFPNQLNHLLALRQILQMTMLAYAGQKLSEVADEFSYDYVSPSNHESVLFEIKTNNVKTTCRNHSKYLIRI